MYCPNVSALQEQSLSHSVILSCGVSSYAESSHSLHELLPGGGFIPVRTILLWRLIKACPVRKRATWLTTSLGFLSSESDLALEGATGCLMTGVKSNHILKSGIVGRITKNFNVVIGKSVRFVLVYETWGLCKYNIGECWIHYRLNL